MSQRSASWFGVLSLLLSPLAACAESAPFEAQRPTGQADWFLVDLALRPPTPAGAPLAVSATFGLVRHVPGENLEWLAGARYEAGGGSYAAAEEPLYFSGGPLLWQVVSAAGDRVLREGRVTASGELMAASSREDGAMMVGIQAAEEPDPEALVGEWSLHLLGAAAAAGGQRAVTAVGRVALTLDPASGDTLVGPVGSLRWPEPAPSPLPALTGVRIRRGVAAPSLLRLGPPDGGLPTALRGPGAVSTRGDVMLFGLEASSGLDSGLVLLVRATAGADASALAGVEGGRFWFTHLHAFGSGVVASDGYLTFTAPSGGAGLVSAPSCYEPWETTDAGAGLICRNVSASAAVPAAQLPLGYAVDPTGRVGIDFAIPLSGAAVWRFTGQLVAGAGGVAEAVIAGFSLSDGGPPEVGTLKIFIADPAPAACQGCFD